MARYSFCHGWMIDPNGLAEVTCKHRDNCVYYCIDFYRRYAGHLDEFEEMFPTIPCKHFIARATEITPKEKSKKAFDIFLCDK